jgi:hypothetical protein
LITVLQFPMPIRRTAIMTPLAMFVIPAPMIQITILMLTESAEILTTARLFPMQARQIQMLMVLEMPVMLPMILI